MRALVIGGAGFIGVHACRELMRRGVETVAAGRSPRPYGTFTSFVAFDRGDESQLRRALEEVRPDVLLDLACYQPAEMEMVVRRFRGERYVFVSTSGVYPDRVVGVRTGEDAFHPLSGPPPAEELGYVDGKRWCETVLARNPEFPATVLRPPAVFGAGDHTLRIAAYLQRIEDGGPVLLPAETMTQPAGLVWVRDAGFGCALACDPRRPASGRAYNLAYERVSIADLVTAAAGGMGREARICPVPWAALPPGAGPYGPPPGRPAGHDLRRAATDLGWAPSPLEEALAETLAWYRVERPSHPGYAARAQELEAAAAYCPGMVTGPGSSADQM